VAIFCPPEKVQYGAGYKSVFLAGSIEMGVAENWQDTLGQILDKEGYMVLNPRRPDWDSSWEQKFENPQFSQQVRWELDNMHRADYIFFYFHPETKAPVTLLELGMMTYKADKLLVCCPNGYWRKGNVDMVCDYYNIPVVDEYVPDMIPGFLRMLK
jgi:hypothetical protein